MTAIQQLNTELQLAVATALSGHRMSDLLATRANTLTALMRPHYNEDLIVQTVVLGLIDKINTNPQCLFEGSIINNGVMHPEIQDELTAAEVMANIVAYLESEGPEAAATMAAMAIWTHEAMLSLNAA